VTVWSIYSIPFLRRI